MATKTFSTPANFQTFVTKVTRAIDVQSRTSKLKASIRLQLASEKCDSDFVEFYGIDLPYLALNINRVFSAVNYALKTGRLHASAEQMLMELSGYQYTKLVIKLALCTTFDNEIVAYLNGRQSLTLPIGAGSKCKGML